ncbi:uncharacterized protein LOC131326714 isoform X3 [Rhododendron vialii]|uniref:uncharacterized protein LOC131326714 isoform X3 n=1 Tax=Rhododendron vialii TaxID=182163 RepID=UPI00265D733B|nr:uncharacterized protein LOC131326714 isoform X3 [Rhododendron vialii]
MLTRVSSTLFFLLDPDIQLKRSKTPIIGEVHLSNLEADVRCGKDVYLPFLKASEVFDCSVVYGLGCSSSRNSRTLGA